jgi:hypothetical protein
MSAFALLADLDDENGFVEEEEEEAEWTTVEQTKKPSSKQSAGRPAAVPGRTQTQARSVKTVPSAVRPSAPTHTQHVQPKPVTHDSSGKPLSDDYYRCVCMALH